jgi:hypothetical protein
LPIHSTAGDHANKGEAPFAMVDYRIRLPQGDTRPDALWNTIPDEHAVRVGRFLAAWSLIEFKLECIIWHLIGDKPRDLRRLTTKLNVQLKGETIDELVALHPLCAEQMKAWGAAKDLIKELVSERNLLAHGVWVPIPFGSVGALLTSKGGIRKGKTKQPPVVTLGQIKPISVTDLDSWLAKTCKTVENLNKLLPSNSAAAPPP